MIVTAKNKIPLLWQFAIAIPWGTLRFKYMVIGSVFIFSLKKFIENPAGITFVMSIPYIMSIMVAPICAFVSDRIWTRYGRRKPFAIPSMVGVGIAFILMPLMPNIWGLLFAYFLYQVLHDFGNGAGEVLKQEVVPPKQRGTAAAIGTWIWNIGTLAFNLIAIGRFDDFKYYAGFPINGEESIYWGMGAAIITMSLIIAFGVKEIKQPNSLQGEKFTIRNVLGGLLNRNLWPVYLLITGWGVANAGLGSLTPLLYVEQWGFTKQEMGINVAIGTFMNMFIIILIGWFADKLPRMKTFEILLFVCILLELSFYLYVEFVLFDKTPSLAEIIIFGEMSSVVGILLGMLYMPLVFDYIPRNEMGTFTAGNNIVGKSLHVITLNGVGVFIAVYSSLFMPPGGDMVRVTLDERVPAHIVQESLSLGGLDDPENELSVSTWYATNASWDEGNAFEIRQKNPESLAIKKRLEALNNDLKTILARKSNAEAKAEQARLKGDSSTVESSLKDAKREQELANPIEQEISELERKQQIGADAFLSKVTSILGDDLMENGSQVLDASIEPVTIFTIPLAGRPDSGNIARTLNQLRLSRPEMIDLVLLNNGMKFFLEASVQGRRTQPEYKSQLAQDIQSFGVSRMGHFLNTPVQILDARISDSIVLDLKTVEDPLNNYVSPITRVINKAWDWLGDPPTPERRIWATGRILRDIQSNPHVGAWDLSEGTKFAFRLQSVYQEIPEAQKMDVLSLEEKAALNRISHILGADNPLLPAAMDLFLRAIPAAIQSRITIPTPVLEARFAPPKYDYMSGYLYMVVMSSIGLGICLFFTRRERKGLIRKRGREESEMEAKAEAERNNEENIDETYQKEYYVPRYVPQKIIVIVCGIMMVGFGMLKMGPDLMLMFNGKSADAIATKVVKERMGGAAIELTSDSEIKAAHERFDRTWIFWNYFAFSDDEGNILEFRNPTGKQLQPEYSLLDDDGLPSMVTVFYNPEDLKDVVIPAHFSTWFLSGLLVFFGFLIIIFGSILLFYARKPIELPVLISEKSSKS